MSTYAGTIVPLDPLGRVGARWGLGAGGRRGVTAVMRSPSTWTRTSGSTVSSTRAGPRSVRFIGVDSVAHRGGGSVWPCQPGPSATSSTRRGSRRSSRWPTRSPRWASSCAREVAAGRGYLPAGDRVLRAFSLPLPDVRVLVVGQDPYPTPGPPGGPELQRRARRAAGAPVAAEHLPGARHRPRPADAGQRRPDAVVRPRRDAAQPGAHGAPRRVAPATRARAGKP